jgi:hypothetical protein
MLGGGSRRGLRVLWLLAISVPPCRYRSGNYLFYVFFVGTVLGKSKMSLLVHGKVARILLLNLKWWPREIQELWRPRRNKCVSDARRRSGRCPDHFARQIPDCVQIWPGRK